jgi:ribose 5-phosphate isomerase B
MKLAIGCDHAGFELKETLKTYLAEKGFELVDKGTYSLDSVDYPDFAHAVSIAIEKGEVGLGILICGSGNGISMAANKHAGIRAALCWKSEIASLARLHNDANILSLPARFISVGEAKEIVDTFLSSDFEGGRHANRVNKIQC